MSLIKSRIVSRIRSKTLSQIKSQNVSQIKLETVTSKTDDADDRDSGGRSCAAMGGPVMWWCARGDRDDGEYVGL